MFIWLTSPNSGQVLVNLNLVTAVICVQGNNTVYFTGGDYVVVTESLEDIYERLADMRSKNDRTAFREIINSKCRLANTRRTAVYRNSSTISKWLKSKAEE